MKKADLILMRVDRLAQQTAAVDAKVAAAAKSGAKLTDKDDVVKKLVEENESLRQEFKYLSAQTESVYAGLAKLIGNLSDEVKKLKGGASDTGFDMDELSSKVAEKIVIPRAAAQEVDGEEIADRVAERLATTDNAEIDYDLLAAKVAERLPESNNNAAYSPADIDEIAQKVAEKLSVSQNIDYDVLGAKVVQNMYIPSAIVEDIDYDALAEKLSKAIPAPEVISPDYIASKVAEQIVIPAATAEAQPSQPVYVQQPLSLEGLDTEELARKVAEKITVPVCDVPEVVVDEDRIAYSVAEKLKSTVPEQNVEHEERVVTDIDEQALADAVAKAVADKLNITLNDEVIAKAVVDNLASAIDSDEIADCVAKQVGSITPEQFEVMVDDDGCDSLAQSIQQKINYDYLAAAIAEKINPAFGTANDVDIDTEELAKAISEKVSLNATVNEDAIADKAAAVLSNYLPEIDTDEIADKVVAGVIPAIPAAPVIDYDNISSSVSEKIVESQEDKDFDIVIDDEGLSRITESISGDIKDEYTRRFNELDGEVAQIKAALTDGSLTDKVAEETEKLDDRTEKLEEKIDKLEEKIEKQIEELKALILSGVVVRSSDEIAAAEADENEELVTVSDIVFEHQPAEELKGDEEQEDDEDDGDEVIDEIVDDIDESLSDGEIMPDGIPGISNGVDFASMMKYNRSFIARIIQGTDDVKQYYGEVKNALLSYKKVNSNIAWGAERFHKGRETIARFKIRGKTLCLYLALDPAEYKTSVYHHLDVTENKSMHGTPMMVKIKSPLGAKKAIRLIDEMLAKRDGIKQNVQERDYAAMYPYESIEELIDDGLVKDVSKK
jgi:hypothetical protein